MAKTLGITKQNGNGKYTMGSSKDESVRGQQKGAAASFKSGKPSVATAAGGKSPGKGYTPPPQQGGRADKVAGTSSAAGANKGLSYGAGKKLGNHYSNS